MSADSDIHGGRSAGTVLARPAQTLSSPGPVQRAPAPAARAAGVSVCLVSHNAYGALTGGATGHTGGVEWQTSLMAKWLAAHGYPTSIVTWQEGGPAEEIIDGVRVIKLCGREAGLPIVRFLHPRWTSLNRALGQANADVYYHNCAECTTGQVALWCRRQGRGFIFSTASDMDCDPQLPDLPTLRERLLYRYGLKHSDRVIVQTQRQRASLHEWFGRDATVIRMPCVDQSGGSVRRRPPEGGGQRILWVGRICRLKRPDRLLELATACPELHFDLVGPAEEDEYTKEIWQRASQIPNITVHGRAPRDQMRLFYQQAACLCCTSETEGFPNTFLEAWSHGLPIVSTFDPDGLIATRELGHVADSVASLAAAIRRLLSSPGSWATISHRVRQYYLDNHTVDKVLPQFAQVFRDVAARTRASPMLTA